MSLRSRRHGSPVLATLLAVATWLGACSDSGGPPQLVVVSEGSDSAIVSDPVPTPAPSGRRASFSVVGGTSTDLVYVSLEPGTIPEGEAATVRSPRTAGTVAAAMTGGGFDPVPIAANAGDSVQVTVSAGGRNLVSFMRAVPTARRPIVIRTDPPPGRRDQPLNARIVVVFSEPVAGATITTSSVQLLRDTSAVPGTVSLLPGSATAAVFQPAGPLDANTAYRLVVTQGVRDLQGDALAGDAIVAFTTGTVVAGSVNSVSVLPDTTELLIGTAVQLVAIARDSVGTVVAGQAVTWSSDAPAVAFVSATGLATTLAEGVAHIHAQGDYYEGVGTVVVTATQSPVAFVALTPDSAAVPLGPLGGSSRLTAVLRDAAGNVLPFRQVSWSTSDPATATVTASVGGRAWVSAVAPGTATITATSEGQSATAAITVVRPGPYVMLSPGGFSGYGGGHTCGVTTDGWALCWGVNQYGELGTGAAGYAYTPMGVGATKFSQVVAAWLRTCALTPDGAAYCWGDAGLGALGIGTTSGPEFCAVYLASLCSQTPVPVSGGLQFTAIGLGAEHACALTTTGRVYCWGYNEYGLLGVGTATGPENCNTTDGRSGPCSTVPVPVTGGLTFSALSGGGEHTCALTPGGTAYCWGQNYPAGQLGDGTTIDRASPVPVLGGLSFVALSVGDGHTCGLVSDGTAYCWGRNESGQLGVGASAGPESCSGSAACSTVPVPVASALRWSSISAGSGYTCGVTTSGNGYCWGGGPLGNDSASSSSLPVPVSGGLTFASLSAGFHHTCGVTLAGLAYCWGDNFTGELGDGTTTDSKVPVKVAGQP